MAAENENGLDGITDDDLEAALESFASQASNEDVSDLLEAMNRHSIITWNEAERVMAGGGKREVVKSGLPQQQRPSEPENATNIDDCIHRLEQNDPNLKEININNMKRTPIPNIQRLIQAIRDNTHLVKLSMANVGLTDNALAPLLDILQDNTTLVALNLETNYLSGEFLTSLFKAMLKNQTIEEIRASNQAVTISNASEMDMCDAIEENETLRKVGYNWRKNEARNRVDQALFRNNELRRLMRREDAKFSTRLASNKRPHSGGDTTATESSDHEDDTNKSE